MTLVVQKLLGDFRVQMICMHLCWRLKDTQYNYILVTILMDRLTTARLRIIIIATRKDLQDSRVQLCIQFQDFFSVWLLAIELLSSYEHWLIHIFESAYNPIELLQETQGSQITFCDSVCSVAYMVNLIHHQLERQ
jgi:hypothetical protein